MERAQRTDRRLFGVAAIVTVCLVVFLLVNIAVSYLNLRSAIDSQREVGRLIDRLRAIAKLLSVVQDAETGQRGFLITGDERYLEPYDMALGQAIETRHRLNALVAGQPELGALNQQLGQQIDDKLAELANIVQIHRDQGAAAAQARVQAGEGRRLMDSIRDLTAKMENLEAAHRDQLQNVAESSIHRSIALMFLSTVFGLCVVGLGFYLIQREIIARRRLAEALQDADRRKNEFLALVGHELRNPLAAITNAADVLRLVANLDETGEETLAIINRQIVAMTRLVNDLLDATRIVHGKLELNESRIDLVEVLRRVVTDARSAMQGRGVSIELELPDRPVWVSGDATRLGQVVGNLVDNAVKFSPRSGNVWVRLRAGDGSTQHATILVVDEGIGVEFEALSAIFEPFVQRGAGREGDRRGLGLGLALAQRLVELHSGRLAAHSDGLGRGTTMKVTLPLDPSTSEEIESCSAEPPQANRCRIVVIDDRRDACYMIKRMLELSGHEVHVASNGPQGIELACLVRPDLVLCDIGLSGEMSGYDVVRILRKKPETAHSHVVAVTGYGQDEVRQRASEAGFHRHLVKPVSMAELNRIIVELPCHAASEKQTADSAGP